MKRDPDLMALADGELDERAARELEEQLERDPALRSKLDALGELGEVVRGHLELSADAVPAKRFDAIWREIDKGIDREREEVSAPVAKPREAAPSLLRRIGRWFDHYRSHIITAAASAGAVAALALILRGPSDEGKPGGGGGNTIDTTPVVLPAEIESLDTPEGTGTVFNLEDEDGNTTVIWVTPDDTVEGI